MDNNEFGAQIVEMESILENLNDNACDEIIKSCDEYYKGITGRNLDTNMMAAVQNIRYLATMHQADLILASI